MKDKFISVFFSVVSWAIWAATISVIVFALVVLFTGMEKPPEFTVRDARLAPVSAQDPALAAQGSRDGWYLLELDMTVSAARYSPFDYTAEGIALNAPADLVAAGDCFVALDAPLEYSKIAPDDYTLRVYLRSPAGAEALSARLPELSFGLKGLTGHFTFINYKIKSGQPGFSLADFTLPQSLPAA